MARATRAANAPAITGTTDSVRTALQEKSNNAAPRRAPVYEDDGNTHGLIKNKKIRGRKVADTLRENADEFRMSGAVALGDTIEERGTSSSQHVATDESSKSDLPQATVSRATRRPPRFTRKPIKTADPSNVLAGLKKRMLETAQREAGEQETPPRRPSQAARHEKRPDDTPSDIEDTPSPSPDAKRQRSRLSMRPPGSVLRIPSTPGVADLSTIALRNFKPRPRQGSMLQLVQHRTTSARPSAVQPSEHDDSTTGFDLGAASDDEVFEPEAEGTPVMRPNSLKRSREEELSTSSAVSRLQAKKRKSTGDTISVSRTGDSPSAPVPSAQTPSRVQVRRSVEVDQESSTPPDPLDADNIVPSTEREAMDKDEPLEGTMADPASSSPLPGVPRVQARPKDTTTRDPTPAARSKRRKQKTNGPSTADLRALLPKRQTRAKPQPRRTIYDLSSEDDADRDVMDVEEDELAAPNNRNGRRKTAVSKEKRKKPVQKVQKAPNRKSTAPTRQKTPITYGRKATSDKENDDYEVSAEVEDSTHYEEKEIQEMSKSKELEEARKKFAAIDDWDLSFESVSCENSESWR